MRFDKNSIMAPIGRPSSVMGVRPILREPGLDIADERSIFGQQSPFGPPLPPPVNITDPVLPRMKPPIIPPRPPSIGGVGGIGSGKPMPINVPGGGGINYGPAPIDLPAPILPDPRAIRPPMPISIGRPPSIGRPIRPPSIGRPLPPISIGGPGGGRSMPINAPIAGGGGIDYGGGEGPPLLPLQPPADDRIRPLPVGPGIPFDPSKPLGPGDLGYIDTGSLLPKLPFGPNPPKPIPPQDFGFGPGIRPTEIFDEQGNIIVGSGGVTPPGGTIRTMDFQDTDMNGVDDRDQPDFSGPSQEYLDQQERMRQIFNPGTTPPIPDPVTPTVDPVVDPVSPVPTTPAAVATDVGAVADATMPMGAIDPVLLQQQTSETLTDPLIRSLYFGTQDSPGFFQQLQQAGSNLIGSDVPLQQTAGLTPLELLAREQAIAGIGGFEPFLQQNRDLVNQAINQSRRAEELRDPYYGRAERQMQIGVGEELQGIGQARGITTGATDRFGGSLGRLGRQAIGSTQDYGGSLGESEDLLRGTLGAYDPGMTQQFYNPYEDAVVQQTIDDVLKAGDKQDIAARAREISSGAFGGSRARLGAEERRQDLGEGLAKALSGIRQTGFTQAQQTGLGEFARQRAAERAASSGLAGLFGSRLGAQQQLGTTLRGLTEDQFGAQQQLAANLMGYGAAGSGARQNLASGLLGIGQQRGAGASALGSQLAGYGGELTGLGATQESLRAGQRGELAGFGGTGRGIAETGLSRIYQQQLGQQQRPLGVLGQIGSMLPGYQQTQTQIDSGYGMPTDPSAAGLGAAFSAYGALAPRQGSS